MILSCRGEHCSPADFAVQILSPQGENTVISLREIRKTSFFGGRPLVAPTGAGVWVVRLVWLGSGRRGRRPLRSFLITFGLHLTFTGNNSILIVYNYTLVNTFQEEHYA